MSQNVFENIAPEELRQIVNNYNSKCIFLVTGRKSYETCGAKAYIDTALNSINTTHFSDFDVNPKIEDVERGVTEFNKKKHDLIIAIGGGSVLDVAKCINVFQSHKEVHPFNLVKNNLINKIGIPLIAIPTTSGSGSEATHFAVLYIENTKFSIANTSILPNVVILNARFSISQSKYLKACSGLDALAQSIESLWSINSTEESRGYSLKAFELLFFNLKESILSPNRKNTEAVTRAAYYAGKAINIAKTTAPHAISYTFTTYFNIPHGHAVYLTLPNFIKYNYEITEKDCNDVRGVSFVIDNFEKIFKIVKAKNVDEFILNLNSIAKLIGIDRSVINFNNNVSLIINNINAERLNNNPRVVLSHKIIDIINNL